jgi:predicted PurR-regulated permease PerM
MTSTTDTGRPSTVLLNVAAIVVIVAGMKAAAQVLVPILTALFLTLILAPIVMWLVRHRVPKVAAVVLVAVGTLIAGVGMGAVLGDSLVGFSQRLPVYADSVEQLQHRFFAWLERRGVSADFRGSAIDSMIAPERLLRILTGLLHSLQAMVANGVVVLLLVIFGLLEVGRRRALVERAFGPDSTYRATRERFLEEVIEYVKVKAAMSLGTGLCVMLALLLFGIDYAVLWGVLAFLLNFVPNIGSLMAAVPPISLALLQYGLGRAVVVLVVIVAINVGFSNLLEPRLMGRSFGISPWVVFAAFLLWSWVLGPVGMVLAVPLTVALRLALESGERTRWVAVLMS